MYSGPTSLYKTLRSQPPASPSSSILIAQSLIHTLIKMAVELQAAQKTAKLEDFGPPMKPKRNKFAMACATLASMTSILLGYDIGVMSGAIIYIRRDLHITDVQVEVLMGIINLYALIGSFLAGRTSDWIGRRYTIVLAGGIFFVGAVLMGFSPNYAFLMFGRFFAGVGVGYAMMIAPVYTAEVSPTSSRGFLTSFPEVTPLPPRRIDTIS